MALVQQRVSKKKQKNLRNILVLPEKVYWPAPCDNDSLVINNMLKDYLGPVKIDIPRAPWHTVRKLTKEERRNKHKEVLLNQAPEQVEAYYKALELRNFLFLGVNSVCKGIEEKTIASCIFDADVSPKLLVSHVADLAKNFEVPVLAITKLKETLKSVLGFSSIAIGFQMCVRDDSSNIFHSTCSKIIDIAKSLEKSQEQYVKKIVNVELENNNNAYSNQHPEMDVTKTKTSKTTSITTTNANIEELMKGIYLYRTSKDYRVFKPINSVTDEQSIKLDENIKLDADNVSENTKFVRDKKLRYYQPLVVHRVQSNPMKKKTLKLKRKR